MMWQQERELGIASNDLVSAVELPYQDDEVAMLVLVPNEYEGLRAVEDALSLAMVDELVDSLMTTKPLISFPKLEMTYELPLKETLVAMGMTKVFDDGDFSGIADGIALADAAHKAFVQVDEQGTRAAAATAVVANQSGAPTILANRPFLFLIRDKLTGSILFLGRVTNPAG